MKIIAADPDARALTEEEILLFLERPHLVRLGLVDERGYPVIYPMWFVFKDDRFWMCTARNSRKARLLRASPHAYFSVDIGEAGRAPRGVRGRAEATLHDDDPDQAVEVTRCALIRYVGTTKGLMAETFLGAARRGETSVIELAPHHYASWSYR
jgi:hypothetical protein